MEGFMIRTGFYDKCGDCLLHKFSSVSGCMS